MNRTTPEYREAVQKVKISFLTEKLGLDIHGIVHVGANDGYEMQWYRAMGIEYLIGVEPLPSAIALFHAHYPTIPLLEYALSDHSGWAELHVVTPGDGQGSSLLRECRPNPHYDYNTRVQVWMTRWDVILLMQRWIWPPDYDCLVMDVQGNEMAALRGFGESIRHFRMLNIECSREPVYEGGAPAHEVEAYLDAMGFERRSKIEEHDDVFFTRRK
jgi:FkbM family methyltransferase